MSFRDTKLSEDEILELKESFQKFDIDGSGCISAEELASMLRQISPHITISNEDIATIVRKFDINSDNAIDFNEFLTMMTTAERTVDDELHEVFRYFDKDHSGSITASEVMKVMISLGEKVTLEECELMIQSVDIDGNGSIDYHEFLKMMKNGFDLDLNPNLKAKN